MIKFSTAHVLSDSHGYLDVMLRLLQDAKLIDGSGDWIAGDNVQLIHLGDTVDRGPDSAATFTYLRDLQASRPEGQVIRLMGNHEFAYCGGPIFTGADLPEVEALRDTMIQDGGEGKLAFAHSLTAGTKDWLLVHAGLDHRWYEILDVEKTADALTKHINEAGVDFFTKLLPLRRLWGRSEEQQEELAELTSRCAILTNISWTRGWSDPMSGVTWCDLVDELIPHEDKTLVNQIVGHRRCSEIRFSPGGGFIGVNVQYGSGQMLTLDLESGAMSVSDLLIDDDL